MFKDLGCTLTDILYPATCHVCGRLLRRDINRYDRALCHPCAAACAPAAATQTGTLPCYRYEGPVRDLVLKFKFGNRPYLADTIVRLMLRQISAANLEAYDGLVPVPLHPARLREREFNQADKIARELATVCRKPVWDALARTRNTRPQSDLNEQQRKTNIAGAFSLRLPNRIQGKALLLVDDVVTTTATTGEAARVLRDGGARLVNVLAFAKG